MANSRIAFGLCKKYNIELPDNATPKDAWEALNKISANEFKKPLKISLDHFSEQGIKKQSPEEIKRGIRKLKKRLEEHYRKIENPENYCEDWNSRTSARKAGLILFWRKECNNLKNGIQERLARLSELGEYYEEDS